MQKIGECGFDNLLAGDFQRSTAAVSLVGGKVYALGSVLGRMADGRCDLVDKSQTNGLEKVYGVLMAEVDATKADADGVVSLTGDFNRNVLTFGGTDGYADHIQSARENGLFFKEPAL